jgi:hypothetical protein
MLALIGYGAGLPMYRTGKWQNHFGVPLLASTQWELIEAASEIPQVIYEALIGVAAQGQLLFNDDTHMRVQSVRQEIATADTGSEQERTGIFTTSIISKTGQRQIALFFTGQKRAGENLNPLLQCRAAGRTSSVNFGLNNATAETESIIRPMQTKSTDWLSLGSAAEYLDVSTDTILRRAVPWPRDSDEPIPYKIRYKVLQLDEDTHADRRYYRPDLDFFIVPA